MEDPCGFPVSGTLYVFAMALLFEILMLAVRRMSDTKPTKEEGSLAKEAAIMHAEAEQFNNPSTFSKWVKMSRKANEKATRAAQLERARMARATTIRVKYAWLTLLTKLKMPLMLLLTYVFFHSADNAIRFPAEWAFPFGRWLTPMYSFPLNEAGAVSLLGWALLCSKVSGRVLTKIFG